jgi:hypothetical protein
MVEYVGSFSFDGLTVSWCNAATVHGYVVITCVGLDDFVRAWELGLRIQQFLSENEMIKAEAVGLHYVDFPNFPLRLFVLPRYSNDYPDSNLLYEHTEALVQPPTSTAEKLTPRLAELQEFLEKAGQ